MESQTSILVVNDGILCLEEFYSPIQAITAVSRSATVVS